MHKMPGSRRIREGNGLVNGGLRMEKAGGEEKGVGDVEWRAESSL